MAKRYHLLVLAAALMAGAATAQAEPARHHSRLRALPPVSGTLRLPPQEFGAPRRLVSPPPVLVRRRALPPAAVEVVRGGLMPQTTLAYGGGLSAAERWATGGTGVSGLIGNTGNPFAGEATWGTANSATTGIAAAPRFAGPGRGLFTSGAEPPLTGVYGDAPVTAAAYDGPAYGSAPAVPFYGSGTPSTMSYYSSGSSAGPYGSPGGLGAYRSGSYGYGPRILRLGRAAAGDVRQGCTCGPRIVRLGHRHRTAVR